MVWIVRALELAGLAAVSYALFNLARIAYTERAHRRYLARWNKL